MPAFPGQSSATSLSVDQMLKSPRLISRDLVNLTSKRFVADRLLVRGTPEMVAGGALHYQRDESIYTDDGPERAESPGLWPRTGWTEDVRTEAVKEYGLEVPIRYTSIRRNAKPQLTIAERKLGNRVVKFVDALLFAMLEADADVTTHASGAVWTTITTDIILELGKAQEKIEIEDNGYNGFDGATLVLHTKHRDTLLNNTALRSALPREVNDGQIRTGMMAPFMGLKEIIFSSQITETLAFVMDAGVAGVIADETPDPAEGYQAYQPPGAAGPAIWVQVYDEKPNRSKIVSGGRWPAMALLAPKAVVKITAISA